MRPEVGFELGGMEKKEEEKEREKEKVSFGAAAQK